MRLLAACSLGGPGHFNPLRPFLAAAAQRGDELLVVGPPALREVVELAGHPFRAGGQPSDAEAAASRERLPGTLHREPALLGTREAFGVLATRAMLPGMEQAMAAFRPDLVLREPWEYSSAVVARGLGIPTAQVAISLAESEYAAIDMMAAALGGIRRGLADGMRTAPYVTRFPASVDRSPFPMTFRFHEPVPTAVEALPDWWAGSSAPLVYVSFGTVLGQMSVAGSVFRLALSAVADLETRVLLTVGEGFDPSALEPLPPNAQVERWVDQARALRQADLVVCHGGSGTVFGALAAAVPLVVVPLFADQFENGRLVARAGAGIVVEGEESDGAGDRRVVGPEGAPRVADAIRTVLGTSSYRREAAELAAEMAATPTAEDVLETLLRR